MAGHPRARSPDHSPLPHQRDVDAVGSGHSCKRYKSADQWGQVLGEERRRSGALRAAAGRSSGGELLERVTRKKKMGKGLTRGQEW